MDKLLKRKTPRHALKTLLSLLLVFSMLCLAACGTGADKPAQEPSGQSQQGQSGGKDAQQEGKTDGPKSGDHGGEGMTAHFEPGSWKRFVLKELEAQETAVYPNEEDYIQSNGSFDSKGYNAAVDAWSKAAQERREYWDKFSSEALGRYAARTMQTWLPGEENNVYSPVNIYLALAMLAEITGGESRAQILDLLGAKDLAELRTWAQAIWKSCSFDDGLYTSILGSSLWFNDEAAEDGYVFDEETVAQLAVYYYACVFHGRLKDAEFMDAFRSWLSDQTHGLLDAQIEALELDPQTVLVIATTIYMKGQWQDKFNEFATEKDVFHGLKKDSEVDFMHRSSRRTFFAGDRFSAISMSITNAGSMLIVLPDEGVSASELLADEQALAFLTDDPYENTQTAEYMVNISLPKFDVTSDLSLIDGLKALGIVDVFDPKIADFSPLVKSGDDLYVSQVQHAARVKTDEDGFEAAAYTVIAVAGSAMPQQTEEIDFVCDRPFLFAIRDRTGLVMFAGIVNDLE